MTIAERNEAPSVRYGQREGDAWQERYPIHDIVGERVAKADRAYVRWPNRVEGSVSDDDYAALLQIAHEQESSVSALVRKAVSEFVQNEERNTQ